MKPLLAKVSPRSTAASARTDIYASTGGSAAAAGVGGFRWEAAITRRPRLTLELLSPTLDGKTQLGRGDLVLNLNRIRQVNSIKTYFWLGAPITVYDATNLDLSTIEATGYVKTTSYDVDTDQLTLNFEVNASALDHPVLYDEFTGGGGVNGDANLRGTLKPAGFGSVQNVEPVWFDNTNNIGMIDGYANCSAITALFEGGNDFGASVADYPDYATLLARIVDKTVAPGRWASCVAQGLVGLGAPPVKPITVDATFGSNRPGAWMRRLLNVHAGIAIGSIDTAAFTALDVAVNRATHHWMGAQRTVRDLIEAIAGSCNATPIVTFQGLYSVSRLFGGATAAVINRQAPTRTARVTKWRALDPDVPAWRMRARSCRPGVTLTIDQINYADTLIDRGVYDSTVSYRQGNLVWDDTGAQWLYINATAGAGAPLPVFPALSNAYWYQEVPPTTAADLAYADGTPIEYLKPAEPGADVTGSHTAIGDGNRVRNSRTELGLKGWGVAETTAGLVPVISVLTYTGKPAFRLVANMTAVNQQVGLGNDTTGSPNGPFCYPVTPGERIFVGANVALDSGIGPAGTFDIQVGWLNSAGVEFGVRAEIAGPAAGGLAPWTRVGGFCTVPAGAIACFLRLQARNNGSTPAASVTLSVTEIMVCSAGPLQTQMPAYTPGPGSDQGADVTALNGAVGDANRVRFSLFGRGVTGFALYDQTATAVAALTIGTAGGLTYIETSGTFSANGQELSIGTAGPADANFQVPVTPGERIFAGAQVGTTMPSSTCTCVLAVLFYNSAGAVITQTNVFTGNGSDGFPTVRGGFATVPPAAAWAQLRLHATNNSTGVTGAFDLKMAQPMVCSAGGQQTVFPAFSPGQSSQTTDNATSYSVDVLAGYSFPYNHDGSQNYTAQNIIAHLKNQAGTSITTGITWKYAVVTGSVNGHAGDDGVVEYAMTTDVGFEDSPYVPVTALGAPVSVIEIRAYQGVVMWPKRTELDKNVAPAAPPPPPGSSGAGSLSVSGYVGATTTSSTPASAGSISGTTPSGVTAVTLTADLTVDIQVATAGASVTAFAQFQQLVGSTWTNIGSSGSAISRYSKIGGETQGEISLSLSVTGLTASTPYQWRVVVWATTGAANGASVAGPVSLNG
jgi:hypothetical protein